MLKTCNSGNKVVTLQKNKTKEHHDIADVSLSDRQKEDAFNIHMMINQALIIDNHTR